MVCLRSVKRLEELFEVKFLRRSWAKIDLSRLISNVKIYKEKSKSPLVMAVVKADAYGHGDIEVAHALWDSGIDMFAVSNACEGIRLREAGIAGEILILGYTPADFASELVEFNLTQTLISSEYAEELSQAACAKDIKCQFAIDTGMRRVGICADDPEEAERIIRSYADKLRLNGIYTHLCVCSDKNEENIDFTKRQLGLFCEIARRVGDLSLPYVHSMNSAGGLLAECGDIARLGIVMYGLKPDSDFELPQGILPVLEWKTVISMVKTVKAGESIGYGRSYIAERDSVIATLPVGYADGYNRLLSNNFYVLINGKRAKITGKICMDQMMVDVTGIDVNCGDEVVLIGRSGDEVITADGMADRINTIGYEVVCNISKRVSRVYN